MSPFPETIPSWFCIAVQQVCFWPFWPFPAQRLFSLDSSVVSNKAAINGLSCPTNPTPGQQKNCKASLWASYHYQMDNTANANANRSSVSFSPCFKIHIHSTFDLALKSSAKGTTVRNKQFFEEKDVSFSELPPPHPIFSTKFENRLLHELFLLASGWHVGRI